MVWYGVKTLILWVTHGKPKWRDDHFDPHAAILEERVLIIRAKNFDHAIAKAEKATKKYLIEPDPFYPNFYGQKVRMHYLGACDAYELFDSLGDGAEVYSATRVVDQRTRKKKLVDLMLVEDETKKVHNKRRKFYNAELRK